MGNKMNRNLFKFKASSVDSILYRSDLDSVIFTLMLLAFMVIFIFSVTAEKYDPSYDDFHFGSIVK